MIVHVNPADTSGESAATPAEALARVRGASSEKKMVLHSGVYYGTSLSLTEADDTNSVERITK